MILEMTYTDFLKKLLKDRKKTLMIARGLPGSGKSSFCMQMFEDIVNINLNGKIEDEFNFDWHSTDDYFLVEQRNGRHKYVFDASQLGKNHELNRKATEESMNKSDPIKHLVVVDNTNTTWKEIKPYCELAIKYGYDVLFVTPQTEWAWDVEECARRNEHGVPKEVIQKMKDRFESNESIENKYEELKSSYWAHTTEVIK